VIASADGEVRVNPTGGPGLATGGTGDVLAGAVGALLAQGVAPFDAAALAAHLHGTAGEAGEVGLAAAEVARRLPAAWRALRERAGEEAGDDALRPFP
jgi:NAD(P)H-hydrate epimerase